MPFVGVASTQIQADALVERRKAQMNGHGEKISRKREQAITALLAEPTLSEAAVKCGVSESTLRRWVREPEFADSYRQARECMLEAAINKLHASACQAADVLREISTDKGATSSSRVSAARAILEITVKVQEFHELERRVEELENCKTTQAY
jgi:hypothetical protein